MTAAIIGTGGIGSVIARQLASGGETLRLSSAGNESARTLAAEIGRAAVVAVGTRDALQGADAVVLALRLEVGGDLHDLVVAPTEARSLIGAA
jgi:8-hydroxy-5-deazaflavin:NADPH oxidoreductase